MPKPEGILIHQKATGPDAKVTGIRVHVVHVMTKSYGDNPLDCKVCGVIHPVKAIHLWLNEDSQCLVSPGVLEDLKLAGLEAEGITVVGQVKNPPPIRMGKGVDRFAIDKANNTITIYRNPIITDIGA